MGKRRKKRKRTAESAKSEQSPVDKQPLPPASLSLLDLAAKYRVWLFLVGLLVYLALFFTSPQPGFVDQSSGEAVELSRLEFGAWLWLEEASRLPGKWIGGVQPFGLAGRLEVVLLTSFVLVLAGILGDRALSLLRIRHQLTYEYLPFALAVGLNLLSLFTLALGLLGGLSSRWSYLILGLAALLANPRQLIGMIRETPGKDEARKSKPEQHAAGERRPTRLKTNLLVLVVYLFAAPILLGAMNPPRHFDVREYHLQTPKEWFQQGHVDFMPHNVYANMPLGPQLLCVPAMALAGGEDGWWWGSLAGKTVIACYSLLTALALFCAGARFVSPVAGAVAGLVYLSIPWVARVSMEGLVDGALAANLFLALYAVLLSRSGRPERTCGSDPPDDESQSASGLAGLTTGPTILAGFLAGAAVSCKYTAAVFVVLPLLGWVVFASWKQMSFVPSPQPSPTGRGSTAPQAALVFLLGVLAGCGLWLGKNWVLAGNPVYPLAYEVFGGQTRTDAKDQQWQIAHAVPRDERGRRYSPTQLADAIAQVGWRSAWLSPILLPLAVLSWFVPRQRRLVIWLWSGFGIVFVLWWLLTHRIDRFWIIGLPLLAMLAGIGVTWVRSAAWQRIAIAVLFWGLVWNLLVITCGMVADNRFLADLKSLREDPRRVNPAHRYLNKHVPEGKRALLVGDAQPFDLEVPAVYNTCFDDCQFEQLVKDKPPRQQWQALADAGVSHVYIHWGELARYRSPGNYGYSEYVTPPVLKKMVASGVLKNPWARRDAKSGQPLRHLGEVYPVPDRAP